MPDAEVPFLQVKRINPRFRRTYGHWWVEVDGVESYGWWPSRSPVGMRGLLFGLPGTLNAQGVLAEGTPTRDPYHGDEADHAFHPLLVADKDGDVLREQIRAFAAAYEDVWRWQWWWSSRPTRNCRSFQDDLFAAVGLVEHPRLLYTRGPGCPFMYPLRQARWRGEDAWGVVRQTVRARLSRWGREAGGLRTPPL